MDLRSDYPYWLLRKGIIHSYPSITRNEKTYIAVIGGGISGALVARELILAGYDVILVDRRHIGMGSTAASTSLLQYEIDVPLARLSATIGEKAAARSYELCKTAISKIELVARQVAAPELVAPCASFQFASHKADKAALRKEYEMRRKYGFRINWLEQREIESKFHFSRSAGILSEEGAVADAYSLTHALLADSIQKGLKVFDHTWITDIQHGRSAITLTTARGQKITAKKLVIACGYESQRYIRKRVQSLHSTFAIVSEQQQQQEFWHRNAMIWETQVPYLYLRATDDNRIIIGGKDIPSGNPKKRDALLGAKANALRISFLRLFPGIPFRIDFRWAGSFASTKDGLPYIGAVREHLNTYFAMGAGGNGITFSVIAAGIINDLMAGRKNADAGLFSFDR
jgi:glycine/D-amino acid oxidase-like deaminating enzyme